MLTNMDNDMNNWDYLWSITRNNLSGDVYVKNLSGGTQSDYMLICTKDKFEVEVIENTELDYCREVAENFVMYG